MQCPLSSQPQSLAVADIIMPLPNLVRALKSEYVAAAFVHRSGGGGRQVSRSSQGGRICNRGEELDIYLG